MEITNQNIANIQNVHFQYEISQKNHLLFIYYPEKSRQNIYRKYGFFNIQKFC